MQNSERPNILLIMADQWRFDWVGYQGRDFVVTPNIDRLAAGGRVFNHCYTTAPLCVPARISLASGLYPHRVGALDNHAYYPHSRTTYYQRLRNADYEVGCVGKLDLVKPDHYNGILGRRPATFRLGFTDPLEVEGKLHAKRSYGNGEPHGPYTHWLAEHELLETFRGTSGIGTTSPLPEHAFADSFIGRRACDWIRRRTGEYPWHLFVSFVGPHAPFDPPERLSRKHADSAVPDPIRSDLSDRPAWVQQHNRGWSDDKTRHLRRQYLGAIEAIDIQVGEIVDTLAQSGELERTWIVFASDHGEMLGDLGMWGKRVPYDPATRVPLVISGPDVEPGRSDALVSLFDLNPTICAWAGLSPQPDIDACSLDSCVRGERETFRDVCFASNRAFYSLRSHDHLFVEHSDGSVEFYDMGEDPHATRNIEPSAEIDGWKERLIAETRAGEGSR